MSKTPTRLTINTCEEMLAKLKFEYTRLLDSQGSYDGLNFMWTAHHLYVDWISRCGSPLAKQRKTAIPMVIKSTLQGVLDISNGNKHWLCTNEHTVNAQKIEKVTGPVVADWLSYFRNQPTWYFDIDGYRVSLLELATISLRTLKWILLEDGHDFPDEIQQSFQRYPLII